jgi:hypothetical protein
MSTQKELQYLSAGVPELENYLLSEELYCPIGLHLEQLTLGGVLLSLARAGKGASKFEAQVKTTHSKLRVAWEAKALREVRARSELWMNYLAEYRDDPKAVAHLYSQNVRCRAMMTLLGHSEDESDGFVRSVFKEGKFVWEEDLVQHFPRESFWYLYGTLKE